MKSHTKLIFAIPISVFVSFCANARMIKENPVGEIPFHMTADSRIYVTAFANGSDSLRFLVDTGASSIGLNTNSPKLKGLIHDGETISILGTTGEKDYSTSEDNIIEIGTLRYENAKCVNIPYPSDYWDGIFGLNGLSEYNIEINYDDHKIYCYPKDKLTVTGPNVAHPFCYKYGVPFIKLPIRLNGKLYKLLLEVDTGSVRTIDLNTPFVNKNNLLETTEPYATSYVTSSDGGTGKMRHIYFDEVIVGPYVMPNVASALSTLTSGMLSKEDIDGMIGNDFLKRFNMAIDFNHHKIYLQPNNLYYTPFYDFIMK